MSAMTPKHADLKATHNAIDPLGVLASIQFLGNPISDPYMANLVQDGKYKIITDPSQVIVGDLVQAGTYEGTVTAILTDGEVAPANNRIEITLKQRYPQQSGVDAPVRKITYDFVTNDEGLTDEKFLPNKLSLESASLMFLRKV